MMEINKTFLLGNLTRDPDVRYLPSGTIVAEFDLAVNRTYKDRSGETKQETLFIRVESMGKLAEFVSEYLKKGRRVFVEGRLRTNAWEGKDGQRRSRIVVHGERIQFADPKPSATEKVTAESQDNSIDKSSEENDSNQELPSVDVREETSKTENDLPF